MGLVVARLSEMARNTRRQDALTEILHGDLTAFKGQIAQAAPGDVLKNLIWKRREKMRRAKEAGQQDKERRDLEQRTVNLLEDYKARLTQEGHRYRRCRHGGGADVVRRRGGPAGGPGRGDRRSLRQRLPLPGADLLGTARSWCCS